MDRKKLLSARAELSAGLRASEDWQPSYQSNPRLFKTLLSYEAQLENDVAEYFHSLSDRAVFFVDWTQLPRPLMADATPGKSDPVWDAEQAQLQAAIIDVITSLLATGAQAGEATYGFAAGLTTLDEDIMKAARNLTSTLVSGVTDTTRDLIRESIQQSIARGEDIDAAKARIMKVINNPVRAEMIAHTESVNSYQLGLSHYSKKTGALRKEWEALPRACPICSPLAGKIVGINEQFELGDGTLIDHPSAHPRCRCGMIYHYN
jgi:hypothetical protein